MYKRQKLIKQVYISTDIYLIKRNSDNLPYRVISRPVELAGDDSSHHDVMIHGIDEIEKRNNLKSKLLYDEIDRNSQFKGFANVDDRSIMNETFNLVNDSNKELFEKMVSELNISGINGHRSVGGYRASLYNALSLESVKVLVDVMKELPMTLLLRPFNFETLPTYVYQFAKDELLEEAALPALIIVATGIIPVIVMNSVLGRLTRR